MSAEPSASERKNLFTETLAGIGGAVGLLFVAIWLARIDSAAPWVFYPSVGMCVLTSFLHFYFSVRPNALRQDLAEDLARRPVGQDHRQGARRGRGAGEALIGLGRWGNPASLGAPEGRALSRPTVVIKIEVA